MDDKTKNKLKELDKDFRERLKWITSQKYEIPKSYSQLVRIIRKMYIKFVEDIFKEQIKIISSHKSENHIGKK